MTPIDIAGTQRRQSIPVNDHEQRRTWRGISLGVLLGLLIWALMAAVVIWFFA